MQIFTGTRRALLSTAALSLTVLAFSPASAQTISEEDAAAQESAGDPGVLALEEIVVTGERSGVEVVQAGSFRGARQLDVPLTVSVIPKDLIDSQQAQSLLDALRNTAGVTASEIAQTTYSNLAIRGIPVENRGNYRLNGALPIINLIDLPLEDKVRVEALKGASALYYGFSSPSGVINMVMKRPTRDPHLYANLFGNSHGAIAAHVDYGNTWGDGVFGARLNGVYGTVDSGIDNTSGSRFLAAGAFDFKPTDTLTISLDAERIFKTAGEPGVYRFLLKPQPTVDNPYPSIEIPPLQRSTLNFGPGDWADYRSGETNVLLAARWKFHPAWELSASAGTSRHSRDRHFNTIDPNNQGADGLYQLRVGLAGGSRHINKNIRAELAGTFQTGPAVHNLLIGASQNVRDRFNSLTTTITFRQSITDPFEFPEVPIPTPDYGPDNNRNSRIDDIGYYLFDRISFGEIIDVLGGIRFSDYTESELQSGEEIFHTSVASYSGGLVVKPTDWISAYGTYIEGLETTPGAPLTAENAGDELPPTDSRQYEVGVKVEPRRGLLFQASYFDIERGSSFTNAQNIYVLDGRERYRGLEVSLSGTVTRNLSLYASALFLKARYDSGADTVLLTAPNGDPLIGADGSQRVAPTQVGKRIENSPNRTWSVAADYKLYDMVPGLSLNAAAYYVGSRALNPLNQAIIPGYTLFDLGAGYTVPVGDVDMTFRVNWQNVGGKKYWASTGADLLAQGGPSTVRLSASAEF